MTGGGAGRLKLDTARLARTDDWMQRLMDDGRFTGSSVLIAQDGDIAYQANAGLCSVSRNRSYERDTIVRIYSMTKMITTVGFMMLVERGLVHLDARLSNFIPGFSDCVALKPGATDAGDVEPAPTPTLHQLLTHTSGLTYSFNPGILAELYAGAGVDFGPSTGGLERAAERAASVPLAFQPGKSWEYSIGIDLIGRVVEVISGRPLDRFLNEEIFEPLGMVDTAFSVPPGKVERFADCYTKTPGDPLLCTDEAHSSAFLEASVETFSGGGGLVSTLDDYFRFGEMIRLGGALDGNRLLSPATLALMRRNHLAGDISSMGPASFAEMPMDGMGFGLGGAVVLDPARARLAGSPGDFGWGGMASTFFWTDPVEQLTCIFFTQLIPSSSYPNRAELKALVHAALID